MSKPSYLTSLSNLYFHTVGSYPDKLEKLPQSGSDRVYYRLHGEQTFIGAYNEDIKENEAFYSFTTTFFELELRVPQLIAVADDRKHYLLSDLGDQTLFRSIQNKNQPGTSNLCYIKKALAQLIQFQLKGGGAIDFSLCYPRESFDRQSIQWDLNYFKYEFLKLANVPFDEQALEDDFNTLANYLLETESDYFMFRDFQSRNIMIKDDQTWFIDYQGGRKGPLQYDIASLLYSPKTKLNDIQKESLLEFYLSELETYTNVDATQFKQYYYGFVLIRILQAMGAYGFRGLFEKKNHFKASIPDAIANLDTLFVKKLIPIDLPEIKRISQYLAHSSWAGSYTVPPDQLRVRITSFSYKKGIPDDPSENGGGFAFDCRGLPNPGRYAEYKSLSGLDQSVQVYLEKYDAVAEFQENVRKLVGISLNEYLRRGFNHLCVNFGCTGGQHRSVYHAEKFKTWLENNFPVQVVLIHTEKNNWKKNG